MEKTTFVCDAPGCSLEIADDSELRLIEVSIWSRETFTIEKMHACSRTCEAKIHRRRAGDEGLRDERDRLLDENEKLIDKATRLMNERDMARMSSYGKISPRVEVESGWYVIPGKKGFEGAGWFATREAAQEGLERLCLGPFSSVYAGRHARGGDQPVLPSDEALRDLVRIAGVVISEEVVRRWNEEQRCEVEAWAAFTLSDLQLGVRRAPPEPACLVAARRGKDDR